MSTETNHLFDSSVGARTYSESVARGHYLPYVGALFGKYDNVRSYWEDQFTREALHPYLVRCIEAVQLQNRKVRIVDLGCGSGQGYEFLTRINKSEISLSSAHQHVLEPEDIEIYLGLDLSAAMVEQGRLNYIAEEHVQFEVADLRDGLAAVRDQPSFDVYFSSYGSLSHLDYASLEKLMVEIADHARYGSLIVTDMMGRYSLEWPGYWGARTEEEKVRDYSMSYLYPEQERANMDIERFPIRFWSGDEIHELCARVSQQADASLTPLTVRDRSLMVGRHIDTGEYGTFMPPLRRVVSQLHEDYMRTDLSQLLVEYHPVEGFPELNAFFDRLIFGWNQLIRFTIRKLNGERIDLVELDGWHDFHPAVQMAIMSMDRVVDSVAWMRFGDVRANIIEPQLSYLLQSIEAGMQEGRGCGHGLLSVIRVDKID
jgi:SAM-dependent methyltransferase